MSSYADTLEALSKAATARPWRHIGEKGNSQDHYLVYYPKPASGQVVAHLGDAIYHDSPDADVIASLANHADDFVRLLRAAERVHDSLIAGDVDFLEELGDALAAFEEK